MSETPSVVRSFPEITLGHRVMILCQKRDEHRFTVGTYPVYLDRPVTVGLDELQGALTRARENAECNGDAIRACSMMECGHEVLRAELDALLARLGKA